MFKQVFGDPGNQDLLVALLRAVLDLPEVAYTDVTLANPHLGPDVANGKESVLDVMVVLATGEQVDVEIQVEVLPNLRPRIMFYTAKMLTGQLGRGQDYGLLRRAVSVLITPGEVIPGGAGYHHRFWLVEPGTGVVFSDLMEVDTLELAKVPVDPDGSDLWKWLVFLKASNEQELAMAAQLDPVIGRAATVVHFFSEEEQSRLEEEAVEKARRDRADLVQARDKAEQHAREAEQHAREAKAEERAERIRRAVAQGVDTAVIMDLFETTPEEIARLSE
jgi:predicted transposase/invertase (TIGR01784 family)